MKKITRLISVLICVAMMIGAAPVMKTFAASISTTTQLNYTAANENPLAAVTTAADGSFKMTMKDNNPEALFAWDVTVDVKKVPYWVIDIKTVNSDNGSTLKFLVGDYYVSESVLSDQWIVVDLTPYATNGVFTGKLNVILQDYQYATYTNERSSNEVGGMWLSTDNTLGNKVEASKKIATVDYTKLITKKTVLQYDDLLWDRTVKHEKVSNNSFAMWINPDQELEYYGWWGCALWRQYIDLDKVPYLYVNLDDNETAYALRIMVLQTNGIMKKGNEYKVYTYVTAAHPGWQAYDLKSDIKSTMGLSGKQIVSIDLVVDDGSAAKGQQNYIKEVYLDSVYTKNPGGNIPTITKSATPTTAASSTATSDANNASTDSTVSDASTDSTVSDENSMGVESTDSTAGSQTSNTAETSSSGSTGETDGNGSNLWIYLVIAAVAVLGCTAGLFLYLKKKKSA